MQRSPQRVPMTMPATIPPITPAMTAAHKAVFVRLLSAWDRVLTATLAKRESSLAVRDGSRNRNNRALAR